MVENSTDLISISIILPVYNGGNQLLMSVKSILDQSFKNWELIIIDDGSYDGSIEQVQQIKDRRIKIYRNECNQGISYSLNKGIDIANGRYIARMDHDDICHPRRLELQYYFLENNSEIDLVGSNYVLWEQGNVISNKIIAPAEHVDIISRPWLGFAIAHPTWMARSDWFKKNRYKTPGPYYAEDAELLLRTYKYSKFSIIQKNLLLYNHYSKSFKKLIKIRISHLFQQIVSFRNNGDYVSLLLSIVFFLVHIIKDLINFNEFLENLFRRSNIKKSSLTEDEKMFWISRIHHLFSKNIYEHHG